MKNMKEKPSLEGWCETISFIFELQFIMISILKRINLIQCKHDGICYKSCVRYVFNDFLSSFNNYRYQITMLVQRFDPVDVGLIINSCSFMIGLSRHLQIFF